MPFRRLPSALQMSLVFSGKIVWKSTKVMNMNDLSRDDDYLSHLFIEKLGSLSSVTPLIVHKMDPKRQVPKTRVEDVLAIVQRLVRAKPNGPVAIKQAVNELLHLHPVRYFIRDYEQHQINAFATHATRYLELYLPTGSIEIAQTTRYSKWTGKNELCIIATRPMTPGFLISELKGSMADLTDEEDRELKRTGPGNDGGTRRDFSVIHSKQLKKNHLFLGPARFVNHDCDNNVELFRSGKFITFRVIKPISIGQEITAHYGDGYFGKNNRHCLCETCEKLGKGGFAPQTEEDDEPPSPMSADEQDGSDSDTDSDTASSIISDGLPKHKEATNLNERRTRRGVYLVLPEENEENEETKIKMEADQSDVIDLLAPSPPMTEVEQSDVIDLLAPSPPMREAEQSDVIDLLAPPLPKNLATHEGSSLKRSPSKVVTYLSPSRSMLPAMTSSSSTVLDQRSLRPRKSDSAPAMASASAPRPRGRPRKYPRPEDMPHGMINDSECDSSAVEDGPPASATLSQQLINKKNKRWLHSERKERQKLRQEKRDRRAKRFEIQGKEKGVPKKDELVKKSPVVKDTGSAPSCVTCKTPLPEPSTGWPSKYREKMPEINEDCGRCKRHLIIFGAHWPHRNPTPGSFINSPRSLTPSDSARSTPSSKVPPKAVAYRKRVREEDESEVSSSKKLKAASCSDLRSATKDVSHYSGRARVPTLKARESAIAKVKIESEDRASLSEPLAATASTSRKKRDDATTEQGISPSSRRTRKSLDEMYASGRAERIQHLASMEVDDRRDKDFWPTLPVPPAGVGFKRTGLLLGRPNPNVVSRWRSDLERGNGCSANTPNLVADDTDNEMTSDEHPTTPDHDALAGSHVSAMEEAEGVISESSTGNASEELPPGSDAEEDTRIPPKLTISTLKSLGLISRPSPITLSKRIWAPPALIADPDDDIAFPPHEQRPETPQRRKALLSPKASPGQMSVATSSSKSSPRSFRSVKFSESRAKKYLFDDYDASSGEEDVIIPGPSDSKLYMLQNNTVTFATKVKRNGSPLAPSVEVSDLTAAPSSESTTSSSTTLVNEDSPMKDDTGPDGAGDKGAKPNPPVLGPLHSEFLVPSPHSKLPAFVNAGWESDYSS